MAAADEVLALAAAADTSGYGGVAVPDSVFYPQSVSADYPYTADGSRFWDETTPFVDPLVAIPAMAARTTQVRFVTNVVKLTLRHPLLVAKSLSSLDAMFPGRTALGVGLSWIPEEFAWLGLEKATRGRRLDESLDLLRSTLQPGWVEHHGSMFDVGPLTLSPSAAGAIPLLVGGHSKPALKRAAERGDGWVSAMVSEAEVANFVAGLRDLRAAAGLPWDGYEIVATPIVGPDVDTFCRLAEMGVTEVIVAPWFYYGARDRSARLDAIRRFADEVIVATNERLKTS